MLEIIALLTLGKAIAAMATRRGRSAALFVVMLLVLWLGGEFAGAILGALAVAAGGHSMDDHMFMVYLGCLVGAAAGAVTAFTVAYNIPPAEGRSHEQDIIPLDAPLRTSRAKGAIIGAVFGGLIGAFIAFGMRSGELAPVAMGAVAVGTLGGLFGMLSGLQTE